MTFSTTKPQQDLKIAKNTIDAVINALKELKSDLNDNNLNKIIDLLFHNKGKVIITGIGKSGYIARKMAATMTSTGTPAIFLHPAEANHGDLGIITQPDIVIGISKSGNTNEMTHVLQYCQQHKIPIIGITNNNDSVLANFANFNIILPNHKEACDFIAPTTSTTITLVICDIIATSLLNRKSFNEKNFKQFHPGGSIGKNLTLVKDIMHKDDQLPLCQASTKMSEVVVIITNKRLGCIGVIENNQLTGIITDGNIRKWMQKNLMEKTAADIMTKNPLCIDQEANIINSLSIMKKAKITGLFIKNINNYPVGFIHMHDIIKYIND